MKLDFGNATLAGLPTNLLNRLQSVLNAAARSIASLHHWDHLTDTLVSFHWLHAPERINFKLAVLVFQALHGTAPRYLSDLLRHVADLPSRRRLRSATSSQLDVRPSHLVTVGDRSFASVGPKLWNSLPSWWHYIGLIVASFQKETENSLIPAIIPGRYFVVCYGVLSPSWSLKLIVT